MRQMRVMVIRSGACPKLSLLPRHYRPGRQRCYCFTEEGLPVVTVHKQALAAADLLRKAELRVAELRNRLSQVQRKMTADEAVAWQQLYAEWEAADDDFDPYL